MFVTMAMSSMTRTLSKPSSARTTNCGKLHHLSATVRTAFGLALAKKIYAQLNYVIFEIV